MNPSTVNPTIGADPKQKPEVSELPLASRPGISPEFLAKAGVRHVDAEEARTLGGLAEPGLWIPFFDLHGEPVLVNGIPYGRLRLDRPRGEQRYHQRAGSGCLAYLPPGLNHRPPGGDLFLVEGQFKALSLMDARHSAVGLPSLYGTTSQGEEMIFGVADAIRHLRPERLLYLGDNDTCLNWQFSDAVLAFATLVDLPVVCPRIPLDAPGKGIDDCREVLGEGFNGWFCQIIDDAILVNVKHGRGHLIMQILEREREAIAGLTEERKTWAERQLVTMAARLHKEPLSQDRVITLACDVLTIQKQPFKRAVKIWVEEIAQSAAPPPEERRVRIEAAAEGIYCYDAKYFRKEENGCFERLIREDALLHFKMLGLSDRARDGAKETEQALYHVQRHQRVHFAGPICGRPVGVHQINGFDLLATASPKIIEAAEGKSLALNAFFSVLLGEGVDHLFEIQFITFTGWLKRAREALRHPELHLPGHALILCGLPDCGKSLGQTLITHMLGGREADPSLWLTGATTFNDTLWGAEHLLMGDKSLVGDHRRRIALRDEIKALVANPIYPLHPKGEAMLSLRPIWRITLSCNDDHESAQMLPPLSEGFKDKVILLRCYPPKNPFPTRTSTENACFFQGLLDDMPKFLHAVENFDAPPSILGDRFGVKEFHHPALVELIADLSPVTPLGELIHQWTEQWTETERSGPALKLYGQLREHFGATELKGYARDGANFAQKLRQLSSLDGWKDRIEQSSRRFGPNKQKQTIWTIRRANPVKGDRGDRHFSTLSTLEKVNV